MKFRLVPCVLPEGVYADLFRWPDLTVLAVDREQVALIVFSGQDDSDWPYRMINDLLRRADEFNDSDVFAMLAG